LVSLSTAFNEGILVVMADKFPGFATDNRLFVEVVYQSLVLSLGQSPTDADFTYWASQLSSSNEAERSRSRYLMLGRLATESFDPPPASGMTAFNLTVSNGTDVFLEILVAGLLRIQITYSEFLNGYLLTARLLGPVGVRDIISNLLQSAGYAARFRVTSYEGYIDSVKGTLSAADRSPDADPEGDGRTNLEEYSFALVPGRGDREAITELEILDEGGQRFGIFSFRSAKNIQRVEVLVQVSTDLRNWTVVGDPLVDGGEDLGGYIRRRVRIPIESSVTRKYFRVQVRLRG
ncbi:MAG: hypothetical protein JNL10_00600, partial [Verrucomicrobiales bacterium]|nr:hypothetical protein [Verrucomicrobiales bacterium]